MVMMVRLWVGFFTERLNLVDGWMDYWRITVRGEGEDVRDWREVIKGRSIGRFGGKYRARWYDCFCSRGFRVGSSDSCD
jgi:hypothetical protein